MKFTWIAGATLAACLASPAAAQPAVDWSKVEIKTTDLGQNVYLLGWGSGDSLVLTGPDGALLVDTSVAQMGGKITAAVARLTDKPVRWVVNTHSHADHFGANEAMARGGAVIFAHQRLRERMRDGFTAFGAQVPPSPPGALPAATYADGMTLSLNGETIELIHAPAAHTDSDTLVYFRKANVVHMSGTISPGWAYPFYDIAGGGSLSGLIAAQERVLAFADDRTRLIPDEGDPVDKARLQACHDALVNIRSRVQALIAQGKSEAEVVAARPTADLDAVWVQKGAFLTGDVAARMAYQSLTAAR